MSEKGEEVKEINKPEEKQDWAEMSNEEDEEPSSVP